MKRICICFALSAALLAGCAATLPSGAETPTAVPPADPAGDPPRTTFRVAETLGDALLLAGTDEIFTLPLDACPSPVTDGQLLDLSFDTVLETYPAQLGNVTRAEAADAPADDRCGLYLQVLEDLWAIDPGLNSGAAQLGLDLSGVTDLSEGEKAAVVYAFACAHDLFPALTGTWQELADQGYIDRDALYWEDGILFTLSGSAENFDAQKWRSGDGAYFFIDCAAQMAEDGSWSYEVGSQAIS